MFKAAHHKSQSKPVHTLHPISFTHVSISSSQVISAPRPYRPIYLETHGEFPSQLTSCWLCCRNPRHRRGTSARQSLKVSSSIYFLLSLLYSRTYVIIHLPLYLKSGILRIVKQCSSESTRHFGGTTNHLQYIYIA